MWCATRGVDTLLANVQPVLREIADDSSALAILITHETSRRAQIPTLFLTVKKFMCITWPHFSKNESLGRRSHVVAALRLLLRLFFLLLLTLRLLLRILAQGYSLPLLAHTATYCVGVCSVMRQIVHSHYYYYY